MAIHSDLQIYKVVHDFTRMVFGLVKNMPRDLKRVLGEKLRDECLEMSVLIQRANRARNKVPHLLQLLERLDCAEVLLRLAVEERLISRQQFAAAIQHSTSIGKQATKWKNFCELSPAA